MKVSVDGLADAIEIELEHYSDEVREEIAAAFKKITGECVKKLRQTSPKRTGDYAKSWARKVTIASTNIRGTVFNRKFYNLIHLLEHGHALAGGGRVEGTPHVAPVQEWADKEALAALVDILSGD